MCTILKPELYANLQSTHLRTALKIISKWFMITELCYTTPVFACMLFLFLCFVFISADAGMEA